MECLKTTNEYERQLPIDVSMFIRAKKKNHIAIMQCIFSFDGEFTFEEVKERFPNVSKDVLTTIFKKAEELKWIKVVSVDAQFIVQERPTKDNLRSDLYKKVFDFIFSRQYVSWKDLRAEFPDISTSTINNILSKARDKKWIIRNDGPRKYIATAEIKEIKDLTSHDQIRIGSPFYNDLFNYIFEVRKFSNFDITKAFPEVSETKLRGFIDFCKRKRIIRETSHTCKQYYSYIANECEPKRLFKKDRQNEIMEYIVNQDIVETKALKKLFPEEEESFGYILSKLESFEVIRRVQWGVYEVLLADEKKISRIPYGRTDMGQIRDYVATLDSPFPIETLKDKFPDMPYATISKAVSTLKKEGKLIEVYKKSKYKYSIINKYVIVAK